MTPCVWVSGSGLLGVATYSLVREGVSEENNLEMEARHCTETLKPTVHRPMKL